MRCRTLFRITASLLLSLAGFISPAALAQEMFAEPVTSEDAPAVGKSAFAGQRDASRRISLSPIDAELSASLRAKRLASRQNGQPLQIGFARDLPPSAATLDWRDLNWEALPDGGMAARISIRSEGAEALRAAFMPVLNLSARTSNRMELSQQMDVIDQALSQVTLRFAGSGRPGEVFAMGGGQLDATELTWSPVVTGDTMTVEIQLARGVPVDAFSLSVPQLSHLDIHPTASGKAIRAKIGESDACENDILCRASAPSGFFPTANAVARMVFTRGGSSYLCSGTLLNNSNSPKKAHFYTANHCISTSRVAGTLQTYWFYDASSCNGTTVNPGYRTLTGGSWLRYTNATRDVSLLELKNAPPVGAVYAGWNAATLSNVAIEGIHHPAGDVKKYSLGNKIGNESLEGRGPFHKVQWFDGVTEGGSSGSGLFTVDGGGNYQLRGGLYGGYSFCSAPTAPDYYSRLSDVYTSLQPYLSP
ncbi:MAG: serine protease [Betaproteobacteria bacterium]|nr:serine protease [Betaproteobacteria bacterium]